VKPRSTSAAAALKALCPDVYSEKAGVTKVSGWNGCHCAPGTSRVPSPGPAQPGMTASKYRCRIAEIGRMKS